MTSLYRRRILTVVGLILLAGPVDDVAWHHRLFGVAVTVAGSWFLALALVKGKS